MNMDMIDKVVEFSETPRSIDDIKKSYPDEWILLGDPEEDKYEQTISGVVLYHSPDKREVCYLGKPLVKNYDKVELFFNRVTPHRERRQVLASIFQHSLLAIAVFVCWGCSQRREQSARFSEDQISQLGLESTKQLVVLNENSLKLDLDDFLSDRTLRTVELIDSIQYIPLQTTKESLIGEINKLICVASNYFILDAYTGRNVLIFSNDGTFIKTLSTGQRPRDIFRPKDIAVDEEREHLIVFHSTGLSFYDYQGNFIKKEQVPFYFTNFRVIPDGYLFISEAGNYNIHMDDVSGMQVLITDKAFRIISAGLPFHYAKSLNYSILDYTSASGTNVNFALKFSDKVYQYVDTFTVKEKYHLDFSKKKIPDRYLDMNWSNVYKILKENDYYFFMGDYIENETHEFFMLSNESMKSRKTALFRDKTSGQIIGGNNFLLPDINTPLFTFPLTSYKDEFISAYDANGMQDIIASLKNDEQYKYLYERSKELFGHLDKDANPVILRYKIKNFN